MHPSLSAIEEEAFESSSEEFQKVAEEATSILSSEDGQIGNFHVLGRLVKIRPIGHALIVGDLHGDLESLVQIIKMSNILRRMQKASDQLTIFLGDYGDRGPFSVEVYYTILKLKLLFPKQIVLMRGNHEGPKDLMPSPHDLPRQLQARFGQTWIQVYKKILALHNNLHLASTVPDKCLMLHGGLPKEARTIDDLAFAHLKHPELPLLEDMLWSDPDENVDRTSPSPRGAGKLFGKQITDEILRRFHLKMLIRAHEPAQEGFKINHEGRILTLFSCKIPPYFNERGAYLDLDLSSRIENAEQLINNAHSF